MRIDGIKTSVAGLYKNCSTMPERPFKPSFTGDVYQLEINEDEIRQEIVANEVLELYARLWSGEYIENVRLDTTQKNKDVITEYENGEIKRKSFFTKDGYLDEVHEYEDIE